jgi:D-alanyl-D-alanine carboxypeptidase (penicillin-binding protein 5/6)
MFPNARRLVALLLVMTLSAVMAGISQPASAEIPYVNLLFNEPRYASIVVDASTGEVLYEKHADSSRYPASITKLMTLYLTFEALQNGRLHMDDRVTFSAHASAQAPSKLGVAPGESISVAEAVQAMTILSANDAAVAMAEKLGGTESRFAALMTLRAQELGMRNTQFVNANGLPDSRQLSTARDIAIMSRAVMRDFPQYYHYFGQKDFEFRGREIKTHNHMLNDVAGVDGLKTGFINAAGFNIAVSGVKDGRRLIVVVLGGSSRAARDQNAEDLLLTGWNVMERRAKGEVTTVAENLFEPQASGPLVRPPTEQGDADQSGVKIVFNDEDARRPLPPVIEPSFRPAVETCTPHKVVSYVRKHGHKVKVVSTSCRSERLTRASTASSCTRKHGHRVCTAAHTTVASHASRRKHHATGLAQAGRDGEG